LCDEDHCQAEQYPGGVLGMSDNGVDVRCDQGWYAHKFSLFPLHPLFLSTIMGKNPKITEIAQTIHPAYIKGSKSASRYTPNIKPVRIGLQAMGSIHS